MERSQPPKWLPSPQPIETRQGSLGASTFGAGAPAATPSVVLLTREQRIEQYAIVLRVSTLRSIRAISWQARVRSRARSLRLLIQSTIGMCKPHQRCSDNRFHHTGGVCRTFRRASCILRCLDTCPPTGCSRRISRHASYILVVYVSAAS